MKKMFKNLFYRYRSEASVRFSDFFKYIDILKEYSKFETLPGKDDVPEDEDSVALSSAGRLNAFKDKNETIFELYYGNLRIHVVDEPQSRIVQIFLKKQGVPWVLPRKGNSFDENNPLNRSIEIYKWFDVEILGENGFTCEKYKQGVWDKTIVTDLKALRKIVLGFTDEEHIRRSYEELEKPSTTVKVQSEAQKYVDIKNIRQ